jgi:phospholipase C
MSIHARALLLPVLVAVAACSGAGTTDSTAAADSAGATDGGAHGHAHSRARTEACAGGVCTRSAIEHVVVIVQENHSFDSYFGRYCTAPTGSSPSCTDGPACCEAGPALDPAGNAPVVLDDAANRSYDPLHDRFCEAAEIHGGRMDRFTTSNDFLLEPDCGAPENFAYVSDELVADYRAMAREGALADRYFQPIVGASSANDMYLARAGFVFYDNSCVPDAVGASCSEASAERLCTFDDRTIGDLLIEAKVPFRAYAEGYTRVALGEAAGVCPPAPADCPADTSAYPCGYDPGDVPFAYYPSTGDGSGHLADLSALSRDLDAGTLPSVSFVRGLGYHSEHPGSKISAGVSFVKGIVDAVQASSAAGSTLILVTWDESGGYFDHVAPPPNSLVDHEAYGPRIPLLAIGPFARKNTVSHVVLEHSSIVKFIEWNWLRGETGQLLTRDLEVNNLGSLLDPAATGTAVPER